MFFEWLGWVAFGFILAYLVFHWQNYHAIREKAIEKAAEKGVVQVREAPVWARAYRSFTWRKESRFVGGVAKTKVPTALRKPVFNLYIKLFKVDMADVAEQDLAKYSSLDDFFSRPLRDGARPIADACMVSPADCHCYHLGAVQDCVIEDVKGFNYNLHAFFGEDVAAEVHAHLEKKHNTTLRFCVCYLSPSDYHRFHSPADLTLTFRRHFSGRLLGVSEKVVHSISNLFDVNERVLVTGEWKHGFFSMTAVGATNVGAIELDFDEHRTNVKLETIGTHDDRHYQPAVKKKKGDPFGRFLFGSTLVLVFQAPKSFDFNIARGDKLRVGQEVGTEK